MLYQAARELFRERGFRRTAVAGIAARASIAVGSFYRYYPSKEDLFLEIFSDEELALEKRVVAELGPADDPCGYAKAVVRRLIEGMRGDPILREWYDRESWQKIIMKADAAQLGRENAAASRSLFAGILRDWQARGWVRTDLEEVFLLVLFDALFIVDLHAADIGERHFPALIDFFTEAIMEKILLGGGAADE
jgi:AcrR family transcriptional regulator